MARILIVEDQYLVRHSMRVWLEQAGHQVEEAADGAIGLRLLDSRAIDLVVTDILMPNLEGLELIRHTRRHHPHVRIVAVSGVAALGGVSMLETARKLGAHATVAKPFTPRDLNETVFRCLHAQARARAAQ
jgi:DNA-binding NtrC family response regulator